MAPTTVKRLSTFIRFLSICIPAGLVVMLATTLVAPLVMLAEAHASLSSATSLKALGWITLAATKRAQYCPFDAAWYSLKTNSEWERLLERYKGTTTVVRTDASSVLWRTEQGEFWTAKHLKAANLAYTMVEQSMSIYEPVRPGDIVVDCGSHIGLFTRRALEQGARLVVAVEPSAQTMSCFRRTFLREIGEGRVIPYEKAVWSSPGTARFRTQKDGGWGDQVAQLSSAETLETTVELTSIDKIVDDLHLPRVDYIKMDIEGAERHALTGARETLRRFHPRMTICLYHNRDDAVVVPEIVRQAEPSYKARCRECTIYQGELRPAADYFYTE